MPWILLAGLGLLAAGLAFGRREEGRRLPPARAVFPMPPPEGTEWVRGRYPHVDRFLDRIRQRAPDYYPYMLAGVARMPEETLRLFDRGFNPATPENEREEITRQLMEYLREQGISPEQVQEIYRRAQRQTTGTIVEPAALFYHPLPGLVDVKGHY